MKTKKIIILTILAILGLFVWGYFSKGDTTASVQGVSKSNSSESSLTASEVFYNFGTISMKNGDVSKEFIITNSTLQDITLKTVLTSCMCTSAFIIEPSGGIKGPFKMPGMGFVPPANEIIGAGESRVVRVVYNPNAHGPAGVGQIDRFVNLTDSLGGKLQLEIKAFVTP
ncbi:MAG: hypothetical protein A3A96_03930 [Candidatus Zambryskibacteria bacterium RIFCSPLOWO2_01_FULL_39_39]|uniref:PF07610 family protein n=2 Tax=Patescibacteria group TaxID=1783273 RepID=A0A0G0H5H7_9BACT|nr:MAG: hypothetical protein US19_C0049G0004 [Candidatus Daviesbacteria bacterium GW2011_GWB1_36_5]KKQ77741.1 MAG: hypothetical protein UT00_C0006G0043 [Parcubacteria group bacterium GW2011_GWA1_38_7]OHA87096.1 MAG: hypothetical protein A2644_03515 [Candidatus Zambryskibacteria bacterium RIFCSPHIGHO2_01_FULL_39_63]OHA94637.1 MAG: hypothetical protein A3B88_00320 [Candidatus Zambryskibacteria bacterium RIFCSPHIGHO2_02_FULL_39_19]OHA98088.1 MAG: hypothetical protein A3F20_01220 [Candidatus Zambry